MAEVGASSELRRTENIFYPPALRVAVQPSSQVVTAPKAPKPAQPTYASTFPATSETSKESKRVSSKGKEKEATKDTMPEKTNLPPMPKKASQEKEVAPGKALEQAKPLSTT